MACDPPGTTSSSELRDLSLAPSQVRDAKVTVVHNQLRDLVFPLARGHLLYPKGNSIVEHQWAPEDEQEDPDDGQAGRDTTKSISQGSIKTFVNLSFTPTCLTARGNIMACGGQHGELHFTTLPQSTTTTISSLSPLSSRFVTSPPPVKPFSLSLRLPRNNSINNSITILPCWPDEWRQKEKERRRGYVGSSSTSIYGAEDEEEDDDDENDGEEDQEDEAMVDMDPDEEDDDMIGAMEDLPSPTSTIATWPNTVPFLHPPRIPHLSPSTPTSELPQRRTTSFGASEHARPASHRPSFTSSSLDRPGIQYVSSIRQPPAFSTSSLASSSGSVKRKRKESQLIEPRILISNNDQSVKMYSLREGPPSTAPGNAQTRSPFDPSPRTRNDPLPVDQAERLRQVRRDLNTARTNQEDVLRLYDRIVNRPEVSPPPPRFGSSLGFDSVWAMEGIRETTRAEDDEALRRELQRAREHLRNTEETLQRERQEFERIVGMRVGSSGRLGAAEPAVNQQERRLAKVGGTKFKYAINHSSLSPDLKTMVSVGDSTDVYLFEVIDGGREFKRIGTYNAATDPAFSTSWSKDGRKFAVASQDGQVTVWDQRSSKPLAIFKTSLKTSSPSFSNDLAASQRSPMRRYEGGDTGFPLSPTVLLVDPVSGEYSSGASTSDRVAARVVKFSPEGSPRDLMVFSEEDDHIHIVDAKTFNTHVIVPVPYTAPGTSPHPRPPRQRQGVDGGHSGIAGVAFDPTGEWLYAATESSVVEWDLRRIGGGEGGTWGMV